MNYAVIINGLLETLTLQQIEDIVEDINLYLVGENITYTEVYLKQQEDDSGL